MSSGSFVISKYETDDGQIRPIRLQPETVIAASNPAATGNLNGELVRVSGGNRKYGLKARSITLKQNIGAAVDGYQPTRKARIACLTPAAFAVLSVPGIAVTYNGSAWVTSGRSREAGA